jgi:hypothetical protein
VSTELADLANRLEEAEAREREIREAPETVERVRRELGAASEQAAKQRQADQAEFRDAAADYLLHQAAGIEATRHFVAALERAVAARGRLDAAARRPGARGGHMVPEPISVLAGRDPELRELRAVARVLATHGRW